jgi:hypothetical protein
MDEADAIAHPNIARDSKADGLLTLADGLREVW